MPRNKRPSFALAIAAVLASSSANGDDLPIAWVDTTDGYVWPEAPEGAPTFNAEARKIAELDEHFRKVATIAIKGPSAESPENAVVAELDLNGDQRNEIFLWIPRLGGTAGYHYSINTREGTKYREIGSFVAVEVKFVEKKNEWYQIEISSRGGLSDSARKLLTFGKKSSIPPG